ncbi:TadE/TadG family type IV pilus assembly protein [Streptomyces sp. NPDC053048]|uniref:TadE/TadG family type IV pilus assembly protein n=1 Tax=Streptomyces sp. NPDC053048 TaxID=3365694 RepID=UPI0037D2879D
MGRSARPGARTARPGTRIARRGDHSARPAFDDRGPGRSPGYGKGRGGGADHPPRPADDGSASVEFLGFLPLLLLVALGAVHLGLAAFAAQQAGTGARAAARTATLDEPQAAPAVAGSAAMTDWVAARAAVDAPACAAGGTAEVTATVTVDVPAIIPGTGFAVTRHATMPCPAQPAPAGVGGGAP